MVSRSRQKYVPHLIERPTRRDRIVVAGSPSVGTLKSDLIGTKPGGWFAFGSVDASEPKIRFIQPGSDSEPVPPAAACSALVVVLVVADVEEEAVADDDASWLLQDIHERKQQQHRRWMKSEWEIKVRLANKWGGGRERGGGVLGAL